MSFFKDHVFYRTRTPADHVTFKTIENLYTSSFRPAEQLYLSFFCLFYLTKVLKFRSEGIIQKKEIRELVPLLKM